MSAHRVQRNYKGCDQKGSQVAACHLTSVWWTRSRPGCRALDRLVDLSDQSASWRIDTAETERWTCTVRENSKSSLRPPETKYRILKLPQEYWNIQVKFKKGKLFAAKVAEYKKEKISIASKAEADKVLTDPRLQLSGQLSCAGNGSVNLSRRLPPAVCSRMPPIS